MRRLRSAFVGALIGVMIIAVGVLIVCGYTWWTWDTDEDAALLPVMQNAVLVEGGLVAMFCGIIGAIVGAISTRSPRQ
jgi:hypothetical protein